MDIETPRDEAVLTPKPNAVDASVHVDAALWSYLRIRPVGVWSSLRISVAYAAALLVALLMPTRFKGVGFMIPGKSTVSVSANGIQIHIRPRTTDLGMVASHYEPQVADWFRVEPGDTVVDVGAHIGRYTLVAAKRAARVVAVEPDPSNLLILRENITLNRFSNVTVVPVALSNRPGRASLFLSQSANKGMHSLEPDWSQAPSHIGIQETVEVDCETLDSIVRTEGLERVDWLKVDVEGHELAVLEGGQETLSRSRHLIIEVASRNATACRNLLEKAGFELVNMEKSGTPIDNWLLVRKA
jgi:FkbM family methyltransferase